EPRRRPPSERAGDHRRRRGGPEPGELVPAAAARRARPGPEGRVPPPPALSADSQEPRVPRGQGGEAVARGWREAGAAPGLAAADPARAVDDAHGVGPIELRARSECRSALREAAVRGGQQRAGELPRRPEP